MLVFIFNYLVLTLIFFKTSSVSVCYLYNFEGMSKGEFNRLLKARVAEYTVIFARTLSFKYV